jgi:hypothetical protein
MKKSLPTREFAESRRLHSSIIDEARERIAAQHRIINYKEYNLYYPKGYDRQRFDYAHFDVLIEHEYKRLRGLYSIPFTFYEFEEHIYNHNAIYRWSYDRRSARQNQRVHSKRRRHHMWDRWGDRTGTYYRQGPAKMSANPRKKVEAVSDQYQVNPGVARKDWRSEKRFSRDQAKGRCFCKCNLNDARAGRRAWERDMIRKGDYERMEYDKNMFTDGWQCC